MNHIKTTIRPIQFFSLTLLSAWVTATAAIAQPALPPGDYDVRASGAKGDGTTLDTAAINRAIDTAAAAGGGTVYFPAGNYLATSVHLKSNITLYLGQGATLVAATPGAGVRYDDAEANASTRYQDFGHSHWHNSLIWGDGLENVTIEGPGQIFGDGLLRDFSNATGTGNKAIALKWCRNVTIRDITIRHGGWFAILATGVDNLSIDNLKIDTNRDGMDIDCCRNVRVSNCSVNSPLDDGICLKSSYALNEVRATQNVTITNCLVSGYDEGCLLDGTNRWSPRRSPTGRIKFGTESNGGFQNITISNCVFDCCRGLALETVDGGLLEDVSINNITMRNIVNAPIFLRLARRMRGPEGTPVGVLHRVSISNVTVYNADANSAIIVSGVPDHAIEDVSFSNIQVWFSGGGTTEQAAISPPEQETGYPEPGSLGAMPAYGFFLRHVKGVTLDNIQLHTLKDDQRPPLVMNDADSIDVTQVKAQRAAGVPVVALKAVTNVRFRMTDGVEDGEKSRVDEGKF